MSSIKSIRSVERAIHVLRFLQSHAPATLEDVHRGTELPRATVARLLQTLQQEGMVRRGLADALYRNSVHLPRLVERVGTADRLAEAGAPILERLQRDIGWPSDLAVRNGLAMELVETSRGLSPIAMARNQLGDRIGLALSAVGRAYLAACDAAECDATISALEIADPSFQRVIGGRTQFECLLAEISNRGYAVRDPVFQGQAAGTDLAFDDNLNAVAVALTSSDTVWGCINLVWNRYAASVDDMVAQHLVTLQAGAKDIMAAFSDSQIRD